MSSRQSIDYGTYELVTYDDSDSMIMSALDVNSDAAVSIAGDIPVDMPSSFASISPVSTLFTFAIMNAQEETQTSTTIQQQPSTLIDSIDPVDYVSNSVQCLMNDMLNVITEMTDDHVISTVQSLINAILDTVTGDKIDDVLISQNENSGITFSTEDSEFAPKPFLIQLAAAAEKEELDNDINHPAQATVEDLQSTNYNTQSIPVDAQLLFEGKKTFLTPVVEDVMIEIEEDGTYCQPDHEDFEDVAVTVFQDDPEEDDETYDDKETVDYIDAQTDDSEPSKTLQMNKPEETQQTVVEPLVYEQMKYKKVNRKMQDQITNPWIFREISTSNESTNVLITDTDDHSPMSALRMSFRISHLGDRNETDSANRTSYVDCFENEDTYEENKGNFDFLLILWILILWILILWILIFHDEY